MRKVSTLVLTVLACVSFASCSTLYQPYNKSVESEKNKDYQAAREQQLLNRIDRFDQRVRQ
jgi:hypothetical protein